MDALFEHQFPEKAGYHASFLHYLTVCFVPLLITVVLAMFSLLGFEMPKMVVFRARLCQS